MNKAEYAAYEKAFERFMLENKLENLSPGAITCPECGANIHESGCCDESCPSCGLSIDCIDEASFSWRACDCCGSTLGGDRYPASGYSRELNECFEFSICPDCVYYATYGVLDDQTMMDIEDSENE